MVIVTLEDGTSYSIDTESESIARMIVEHKLRDRLDYRKITGTSLFCGVKMDPKNSAYNSGYYGNKEPLKCSSGWSYKWGDRNAEFR